MSLRLGSTQFDILQYERVATSNGATGAPTAAKIKQSDRAGAAYCYFSVNGGSINFTVDGTTPDATHGHVLSDGNTRELFGTGVVSRLQWYANGADVTIDLSYGF